MDKQTLFVFAKRILDRSSTVKAERALRELERLLKEQGAPAENLRLLKDMLVSVPELKNIPKDVPLSVRDVEIAKRRSDERREREAIAARYGRC